MYYLVDYENVNERGLVGCEYLTPNDTLILFYNANYCHISNKMLERIFVSGCACECFGLVKAGSNAIDFYICVKTGELLSGKNVKKLAIISADKGYEAIRDYWHEFGNGQQILLKPNIEGVIIALNESVELVREIQYGKQTKSVQDGVEKLKLLNKAFELTEEKFTREEIYAKVKHVFEGAYTLPLRQRDLYLRCLKQFGRAAGLKIYQEIKAFVTRKGYVFPELPDNPEKRKQMIKTALKPLLKKEKTRETLAKYIIDDTSQDDVESYVKCRYAGIKGHEIMNVIRPFIAGKRMS